MKQRVTIEETINLPKKPFIKLNNWCEEKGYSIELSIGQMIEFLDEHWTEGIYEIVRVMTAWGVFYNKSLDPKDIVNPKVYRDKELADALWQAVNEALSE